VKISTGKYRHSVPALFVILFFGTFSETLLAQTKTLAELSSDIDNYVSQRTKALVAEGKRVDSNKRDDLAHEKRSLAAKYAEEASTRSDLKAADYYYLGLLYVVAEDNEKALDAMDRYLAQFPAETKGTMIQSARSYEVILSTRRKLFDKAEEAYRLWLGGSPVEKNNQPVLEQVLAVALFKDGQYDKAIKYAQEAFDLLKTLKATSLTEKRSREQLYQNLVEVLALSYKKNKNADQSLEILAEARAESFAIPSAELYRKVMDFVSGSGFSEKKLMQKVESYASADAAPNLAVDEWIGQEPFTFDKLRGKVVLIDFWATWCMPCISTFPRLRGWYKKYGGNDFMIVGVTQYYGQQDGKKMTKLQELDFLKDFKEKYKLPYTLAVLSNSSEAPMKYGVNAYPTTVLLDRNGVVRYIGIGAGMEESENLEDMIQKVLKEGSQLADTHAK
jgi:thiol-disulfide isomerase/thioredoxin